MTSDQKINEAYKAALDNTSPAETLCNIMKCLGFNFGSLESVEHGMMQYYADSSINPFVQAQIEARVKIDVNNIETIFAIAKINSLSEKAADRSEQLNGLFSINYSAEKLAKMFVFLLETISEDIGIDQFNDALTLIVDEKKRNLSLEI